MFKSMKAPKNGAGSSAESLAPDQAMADDRNSVISGSITPNDAADTPSPTKKTQLQQSPSTALHLDQPNVGDFCPPSMLTDVETPTAVVIIPNSNTSSSLASATRKATASAARPIAPRSQSAGSSKSVASTLSSMDICRICHCEATAEMPLISPCYCSGTLKYVHQKCLQQWIKSSQTRSCEVCRFTFIMQTKLKPFRKWEKLDISSVERRKILCSVAFHIIAITCVIWSLYVLIDRTAEEIQSNTLEWPFWTKLVVVAIGFTGGLVFMYVQCKMYVQLFRRWKAYNKVIYVQNGPSGLLSTLAKDTSYCGVTMELK